MKKQEKFNVVVCGTGGQGVITLLEIVSQAAFLEGHDIKTSELHGLSQRGGSVEVHFRMGEKVFSPLVEAGKADLVFALEEQETLKALFYANKDTDFLIDQFFIPIPFEKPISEKEVLDAVSRVSKKITLLPATKICKEKFGTGVVAGVYLLSLAAKRGIIPLKAESVLKAIKKVVPEKYLELNVNTFNLAE